MILSPFNAIDFIRLFHVTSLLRMLFVFSRVVFNFMLVKILKLVFFNGTKFQPKYDEFFWAFEATKELLHDEDFLMEVFELDPMMYLQDRSPTYYGASRGLYFHWCRDRFGNDFLLRAFSKSQIFTEQIVKCQLANQWTTAGFQAAFTQLKFALFEYDLLLAFLGGISISQSPLRLLNVDPETSIALKKSILEFAGINVPRATKINNYRAGVRNLGRAIYSVQMEMNWPIDPPIVRGRRQREWTVARSTFQEVMTMINPEHNEQFMDRRVIADPGILNNNNIREAIDHNTRVAARRTHWDLLNRQFYLFD